MIDLIWVIVVVTLVLAFMPLGGFALDEYHAKMLVDYEFVDVEEEEFEEDEFEEFEEGEQEEEKYQSKVGASEDMLDGMDLDLEDILNE